MAMQRRNDQKVVSCVRAKTQHEWDKLVTIAKQCPPFLKPAWVKLVPEFVWHNKYCTMFIFIFVDPKQINVTYSYGPI
jgi:hypothetical protein